MHIAFIMDGNRRWAKKRMMPKAYGHKRGVEAVEKMLSYLPKHGVDKVTLYALSTENMNREEQELKDLFDLFVSFAKKKELFEKNQIKFTHIGKREGLPQRVLDALDELAEFTKDFKKMSFQMGINYGGRDEIVRAAKKASEKGEITEETISKNLDTAEVGDYQLLIRTGGHKRISNFLIWQSAYSEFYFTDKFWPEFNEEELKVALDFYESQQRNFGK